MLLNEVLNEAVAKFKVGDVVRLKKSAIKDLNDELGRGRWGKANPEQTAKVVSAGVGSKNPGEPWRFKVTLDKKLFDSKFWDERFLELAK